MEKPEDTFNLNGEFLGISSLAIYSAPWYLQLPLLLLVALLFFVKVSRHSKEIKIYVNKAETTIDDEIEELLSKINYLFFGLAVPRKNVTAYWIGFVIYLITLMYASFNLYNNLSV